MRAFTRLVGRSLRRRSAHGLRAIRTAGSRQGSFLKLGSVTAGAGLLSLPVAYAHHDEPHDFTTEVQKKQQNHALQLIKVLKDTFCAACDAAHSNAAEHKAHSISNPTKHANNEIYNFRKVFQDAIKGGMLDLKKASKVAYWQQIVSQGVNLQQMLDVDKKGNIPFLAFCYTMIIAEAMTESYKRKDIEAIAFYAGPVHDYRVPVINTLGIGTAKSSVRIADLSKWNPPKFADFLFKLIDRNADGKLDKGEVEAFVTASRILGTLPDYMYFYKMEDKQITDKLFERWDLDNNGTLDKTEFLILNQSFYYTHCQAATAYQRPRDDILVMGFAG